MKILMIIIYYLIFFFVLLYGFYFVIMALAGLLKENKNKLKHSKKKHFFSIIIPARNEEMVIENIIESLKALDYPKDSYEIICAINNCTDNTREIAKNAGARIIECDVPIKSKGDVLKCVFAKLKDDKRIDAYVIFDADNVVHPNFLNVMNDVLESGYNVAQGYRDAKNPSDNWLSGSYTIFYLIQNVFFNHTRMSIGGNSSINGTGFMIRKSKIDKEGFNTKTLTEDVEFTGICALNGEKIFFAEDAITYDEYPAKFMTSWKQRKRWSAGVLDCMHRYSWPLFKNFLRTGYLPALDMSLTYMGPLVLVISIFLSVILTIFRYLGIHLNDVFSYFYASGLFYFIVIYVLTVSINIFSLIYKDKSVKETLAGIFLFPIFILTWFPINVICIFKKNQTWEPIKHDRSVSIKEVMENNNDKKTN